MIAPHPPAPRAGRRPDRRARLLCLAHAGGSATMFASWTHRLGPLVSVLGVELPGRGRRSPQPPETDMAALLDRLEHELRPHLHGPFALFGHSLGGTIAYELARRLDERGHGPRLLVVAGTPPPDSPVPLPDPSVLSDSELLAHVRRWQGTPAELFAHPELVAHMLPMLRADLRLGASRPAGPWEPLRCPVAPFAGATDGLAPPDAMRGWRRFSAAPLPVTVLPGGHFSLVREPFRLCRAIRAQLCGLVESDADGGPAQQPLELLA